MSVQAQRNADDRELAMFDGLAERWWDPKGEMGPLHVINPVRMRYIASCLGSSRPGSLKGLRVLDVGCGGGILSEALARFADSAAVSDWFGAEFVEVYRLHKQGEMDFLANSPDEETHRAYSLAY